MREILFRGKTEDGEWIYGHYLARPLHKVTGNGSPRNETIFHGIFDINKMGGSMIGVIPETVGQKIGLTNEHGDKLEIYEGDIVEGYHQRPDVAPYLVRGLVTFEEGEFLVRLNGESYASFDDLCKTKVLGNIHDHPYLLQEPMRPFEGQIL